MSKAPFKGRWMPVPTAALFELAAEAGPHTVLVWLSMLNDATRNENWQTTRNIESIMQDTKLSKPTVIKAQAALEAAGYIARVAGGGATRKKITFAVTAIAAYGGNAPLQDEKNSKQVENWTL